MEQRLDMVLITTKQAVEELKDKLYIRELKVKPYESSGSGQIEGTIELLQKPFLTHLQWFSIQQHGSSVSKELVLVRDKLFTKLSPLIEEELEINERDLCKSFLILKVPKPLFIEEEYRKKSITSLEREYPEVLELSKKLKKNEELTKTDNWNLNEISEASGWNKEDII